MDEKKNTILQNSAAEAEGPRIPLVNQDIFENDALLINRFFYLSPTLSGGLLICKISYEESVFLKDGDEDLCLLHTTCRTAPDTFSVRLSSPPTDAENRRAQMARRFRLSLFVFCLRAEPRALPGLKHSYRI